MDTGSLKRIMGEIGRPRTRSPLFWWMFGQHDRILAEAAGTRLNWRNLVQEFAAAGLTNANGQPASPEVARLTWKRVRIAVAQRRAEHERLASEQKPRYAPALSRMPSASRQHQPPVSWTSTSPTARNSDIERTKAPADRRAKLSPPTHRWYDDDPALTDEQRAHLRSQDERLDAEHAKLDAKFRLGG